jgi:aromatic ring hydroxylase
MLKMNLIFLGIFVFIQSCGSVDNDSKSKERKATKEYTGRAKKIKATFQEAANCFEAALSEHKDSVKLLSQHYMEKYDKFNEKECSNDDLINALTVVECVKKELCNYGNNSIDHLVFVKTWPKCRHDANNPYKVSDACAQKIKVEGGIRTPYDND